MATTLTLDTPEARRALAQCYNLLLQLAERRQKQTPDVGDPDREHSNGGNPAPCVRAKSTASTER